MNNCVCVCMIRNRLVHPEVPTLFRGGPSRLASRRVRRNGERAGSVQVLLRLPRRARADLAQQRHSRGDDCGRTMAPPTRNRSAICNLRVGVGERCRDEDRDKLQDIIFSRPVLAAA